jgi:hypothetical protein
MSSAARFTYLLRHHKLLLACSETEFPYLYNGPNYSVSCDGTLGVSGINEEGNLIRCYGRHGCHCCEHPRVSCLTSSHLGLEGVPSENKKGGEVSFSLE